ncbi:ZIP family metal transporter [Cetobacterium somerae]|uniref:ZIP family metal transporter n=2 Tax=Cetobacterium TaxID=180162 RepID=UPI002E7BE232|nr:ZIP family metal transporter [Cetobacterium somerae]WVJ01588.1 ZIP family metal transporter [Cetobacterium somerae]
MYDFLKNLDPVLQALLATLFTYFVTMLGAAMVFFFKTINQKVLNGMLGFASGVMIAASFWSLLNPAIELAESIGLPGWKPAVIGFLFGGIFLWSIDKFLPHLHQNQPISNAEGISTKWRRSILLVLAITLHNIPEGLAVGVAFGALAVTGPESSSTLVSAIALAIGIGLQNFPEGAAVSIPLRRDGMSRRKAFFYGQASGIVEPIAGVIGAIFVIKMTFLLPYALAFAAGAMIYVVAEELIPTAKEIRHDDSGTIGVMFGFALMMFLDVALG